MNLRIGLVLACLALVTACGSATGGDGGPSSPSDGRAAGTSGASSTPGPTSTGTSDGALPVTIRRTGGIAGFNDAVVIDAGGTTTVTSKRGEAGRCTLTADTLTRLLGAVSSLPKVTSSTSGPRIADEMFTTVETPSTAGPVRLSDAAGPDLAVIREILADVVGADPAYLLCPKA